MGIDTVKWAYLVKEEPQLALLLKRVEAIKDDGREKGFCANAVWYGRDGLKERMCRLAGWEAGNKKLRTAEAYDVAYDKLYDALPDCRNCGCFAPPVRSQK